MATLTGAIITTFGSRLRRACSAPTTSGASSCRAAGDARRRGLLWRLPLHPDYADAIKGRYADIVNAVEDRKAGSIIAAEFLKRFTGDVPWAHLDIAGVGWDRGRPYAAKGGSASPRGRCRGRAAGWRENAAR